MALQEIQRHEVKLRVVEVQGLYGFLIWGAEVLAEVFVEAPSAVFEVAKGNVRFHGEVKSVKRGSFEVLPMVLCMTGKSQLNFTGEYVLPGASPMTVDFVSDDGTHVVGSMDYTARLATATIHGDVVFGKSSKVYFWVKSAKFDGISVMHESHVVDEPEQPEHPDNGQQVPDSEDGTDREWVPAKVKSIVWPADKKFSFDQDNDLEIVLDISANGPGVYPRLMASKAHHILDVFQTLPGKLGVKLYNEYINFGTPIVGDRRNTKPPDHYGIASYPSFVGTHTVRFSVSYSQKKFTFYWDGKVTGQWNMSWVKIPAPIDSIIVNRRRYYASGGSGGDDVVPVGLIRGLMLTDAACDKELSKYKADLAKWRTKYNTILTLLDLQLGRPYVEWVRNKGVLLPRGVSNLRFLKECGFAVHVMLLNGPNIRKGNSDKMGSIQRKVSEDAAYTDAQLAVEKAFIDDLFAKAGGLFDGIMPILETSHLKAVPFAEELYRYLRQEKGYKGVLVSNMIGGAKAYQVRFKKYGVLTAASQNSPDLWKIDTQDIRNSDGMTVLNHTRHDLIKLITGNPGPNGFYLWSREIVGSDAGRGVLHKDYLTQAV